MYLEASFVCFNFRKRYETASCEHQWGGLDAHHSGLPQMRHVQEAQADLLNISQLLHSFLPFNISFVF